MEKNISMIRGNTVAFGMEFLDLDQDLDSAYFTVKPSYDGEIVFQKELGDGIEKVETGKYRLRIAPEDTEEVTPGMYFYDLVIGVNSDVYTIITGILDIGYEVTEV